MKKRLVEAIMKKGGKRVPLGIMNTKRALDTADADGMEFNHPDGGGRRDCRASQS